MSQPSPLTRSQLVSSLRAWLDRDPRVRAAWEGGSAAFDDVDEWSDVDAIVVVADDAVDAVFDDLERSLGALSPIAHRHDIPATSGYTQRFYRLRDAGEFLVLDLVLIRQSDPLLFREVELHGRGRTWLDRDGRLDEHHLDRDADLEQARQRLAPLRSGFEMFQHLVIKECRRGRACDALAFYQAWTLRPLIEAIRLLHVPALRGFGMRYLARDLPAPVVRRIEGLAYVRDLSHLVVAQRQASAWFTECMDRLQAQGPGALAPAQPR